MLGIVRVLRVLAAAAFVALAGGLAGAQARRSAGAAETIDGSAILHNSWDSVYRSPFGAVPVGTPVQLRLRTAHAGATDVSLAYGFFTSEGLDTGTASDSGLLPMSVSEATDHDTWTVIYTPSRVGMYTYIFVITKGDAIAYYAPAVDLPGGIGQATTAQRSGAYVIVAYAKDFKPVSWAKSAVMYQIFPDRFFNGDRSNDLKVQDPPYGGTFGAAPQQGFCGPHPVFHWNESDNPINNCDFFGGDLQGIIDKLPYLKDLGVNAVYLNPIFMATSNHKYDTSDYMKIDPHFGTLATFKKLVAAMHKAHMHLILDGVFNHTGSDSIYFNRYGSFKSVGAYQSKASPYASFYTFTNWPNGYDAFFGVDTLPTLQENDTVKDFIFRKPDSVAQHWLALGADGWRLDAAHLKSYRWWREFRQSVKGRFPNDILICECDATPRPTIQWILGDQVDGAMNYLWREFLLEYLARGASSQGAIVATRFAAELQEMTEVYPLPALTSSMNLVDSHDVDRITSVVNGDGKMQRQIATFQMTWIGMPTIYYGDEAGLTGSGSDPMKRRFFPWKHQDKALEAFYRKIIHIRLANPALQDGSITPLVADDSHRVFGFLRKDSHQSVAVVMYSGSPGSRATLKIPLELPSIANGTKLTDALSGKIYTVKAHRVDVTVKLESSAILVQKPKS